MLSFEVPHVGLLFVLGDNVYTAKSQLCPSLNSAHLHHDRSRSIFLDAGLAGRLESGAELEPAGASSSKTAEQQHDTAGNALHASSFDRLLEAASSGGMSDNLESESEGALGGIELQGTKRHLNGTANSNSSSAAESAGKAALAKALARHNITAQSTSAGRLAGGESAQEITGFTD